ncbi:hypothetical protein EAL2_c08450 [Peptoclostridium acidaminophilum DSM 3953]|uniref:LrgA family protein n=1 Tax=Peptoclostridium acidaminophilum DSM 3953 TaxID=1286171 RepID=W8T5P0_PEPAC|nr:CidA/LrgA family protein [Peptoclostridium acidaminophilum]AHM56145.1 hypothetical protein EAL2_c08450 [Peptoclostridium acidaminophilum DSM 3953]
MKLLRQSGIILSFLFAGEIVNRFTQVPIPGNVLGMLLLFGALYFKIIEVSMIRDVSSFLLSHLSFFFVPASVGIISCFDILSSTWIQVLAITVISTLVVMIVTGFTVQLVQRRIGR